MVRYERFRPAHLDGVVRLCATEGWSSYTDAPTALRALTAPGSIVVVAIDAGVVGFIQVQTDGVIHAHLSNIVVAPAHRRQGIGRELAQRGIEQSGARYVDLVSTEGAHEFYRSFAHREFPGFRIYPRSARS